MFSWRYSAISGLAVLRWIVDARSATSLLVALSAVVGSVPTKQVVSYSNSVLVRLLGEAFDLEPGV